jgi:hypothetical protein
MAIETEIQRAYKDFPKVEGREKPEEIFVWTVYRDGMKMRARLHSTRGFTVAPQYDAEIQDPLNFCAVVDGFRNANG